jgi:hypothetical protein
MGAFEIIVLIILAVIVFFTVVGIIDGNRFETVYEEFDVPNLDKECHFVMISDVHNKVYGDKNDKVIDEIKKINPDFIIIAGDLVTSKPSEDITPGIELIKNLSRDYKIYYGLGNHETKIKQERDRFGDKFDKLKSEIASPNVIILENSAANIPKYNIRITGLELDLKYFAHFSIRKMDESYMNDTLSECDSKKCNLLIAHNPDYFKEYARWGADLVLSGHVHGGIMRLPLVGGVIAPSYILFPEYDGGVFREGSSAMLLGRGMGSHTIPFRFFNPAQLYDVRLKPQEKYK